jgi:hypothetical protein
MLSFRVQQVIIAKMPPRTRPIEKFAQAVAKCSTEVNNLAVILYSNADIPLLRLQSMANALWRITIQFTRTNVLLNF